MAKQKKGAAVAPKVLEAQHRNEIIKRFKIFISSQSSVAVASQIPPLDYEILHWCKTGGVRLVPCDNSQFQKEELEEIKHFLSHWFSVNEEMLFPNKPLTTLYDILTLGIPLLEYLIYRCKHPDTITPTLQTAFGSYQEVMSLFTEKTNLIQDCSFVAGLMWSSYEKGVCYIYNEFKHQRDDDRSTLAFMALRLYPERRLFKIDGHNREAYRVAWFHLSQPTEKLTYYDITPAELCIKHPHPTRQLKVFIQKHAIERMKERLDSANKSTILQCAYTSLKEPITIETKQNKLLVEVRFAHVKVGYFVATIEEDALLIRTFLFITSNGTPEGDLLKNLTGLQMLDKKYLAIDRLSSFVAKEVVENVEIRTIFEKAGCSYLFDDEIQNYAPIEFQNKHTPAVKLPAYIIGHAPEERWMENEEHIDDTLQSKNAKQTSFTQRLEQAWMNILKHLNTLKGRKSINGKTPETPTPSDAV